MAVEIIIVDDDPLVGGLSNDLLNDAGYSTQLIRDSNLVMDTVKAAKPKLMVLDILMPGIDGLTLLYTIKNDPELKDIKCIVVSGKSFAPEIERAKEYGAELFIEKPYDIKQFAAQVKELIGAPAQAPAGGSAVEKGTTPEHTEDKQVRFQVWGNSEPDSTAVVSMEALDTIFIFDAGRGIIPLGESIMQEGKYKVLWLMLSHFHPDHISGLGLFPPLRAEGYEIHVVGPKEPHINLTGVLNDEIKKSYAVNREPIKAKLRLHQIQEDSYELRAGLRVSPFYANHPTTTMGYLLQFAGRRIVFCPDSEIYGDSATALQDYDEKIGRICMGADLLIHDARYTDEDYAGHKNEGHSCLTSTVEFAAEREIERLILFHYDPSYDETKLEAMQKQAAELLDEKGSVIECHVARDGLILEF
ncbi:MAG: response regulator [Elusimicrobiota bacterium]